MQYIAFAEQLGLPHWLIIAGGALVLFGVTGIAVDRPRGSHPKADRRVGPKRKDRLALPASSQPTQK